MKVAIVDDEQRVRDTLKEYIAQFSEESEIKLDVETFESGDLLLKNYKKIYDIIIFDIDMPGTNGMNTARKIREKDQVVTIIFITNIAQYAINGYEVDAVDYIIKPISYYDFSMKFHRTVAKAVQKEDHVILIETAEGTRRVHVSSIMYVEVLSHYLYFHTQERVYKARGSMSNIERELNAFFFQRVHRSFIINLEYVEAMDGKSVTVCGNKIPLGRGYKDQLMQSYMKYSRGEL
ncbi:DNA-binding response regulator [Ruminococcus sp. AF25-17]|jgi:two-component system response regulator LytT|nr:DNA-binding response regulator [Ruminococcus sp. AF25-17]